MIHGPDPYTQALADLDELLARDIERNERALLDMARRYGEIRNAGRSLANAALATIRDPNTSERTRTTLAAALAQWQHIDKQ